jgi:hypothetical protein
LPFVSKETVQQLKKAVKFLFAGLCITVVSLSIHLFFNTALPQISASEASYYVNSFVQNWDSHRIPIQASNRGLLLNVTGCIVAAFWLKKRHELLNSGARFLLATLLVASILGCIFAGVSRIDPWKVPLFLTILMPARILELNVLAFLAVLIGMAGRLRKTLPAAGVLFLFSLISLLISPLSFSVLAISSGVVACLVFLPRIHHQAALVFYFGAILIFTGLGISGILKPNNFRQEPEEWNNFSLIEQRASPVLEKAKQGKGLLLTGSDLHLIQLRTRRPVVLDGGQLDTLPYTFESGPQMSRILDKVYGVDFFHAPPESRRTARIRSIQSRVLWERRSAREWQEIAKQFQFTQILTYRDWKLNLPLVSKDRQFSLFDIP